MFINIQLEIPQLCILKDHHLIIEIIKSCNNLLLKLFSIYGIGASYEGHKGSQTCLIGYLHSVTIKFYYFKNWFSQAILFTKNKNKIIVFFYHCICLCILFSLENKNQIALSLSKHNNLYWTHADVVLVQWISLNTRKSRISWLADFQPPNSCLSWHIHHGKFLSYTSLSKLYCSLL